MRQHIIDRRLAGKNKSIGNRERFLRRYKTQVREAVQRAINGRSIRDIEKGEDIAIPKKDLSEPTFRHGEGGTREVVLEAGHCPHDEVPEQVNAALLQWLEEEQTPHLVCRHWPFSLVWVLCPLKLNNSTCWCAEKRGSSHPFKHC